MEKQQLPSMWENMIHSVPGFPLVVQSVQRVVDQSLTAEKESAHDAFELVYVYDANKTKFEIAGEVIEARANDVFLIKPHTPHKLDVSGKSRILVLKFMFRQKDAQNIASVSMQDFIEFVSEGAENSYINLKSSHRSEIVNIMQKIVTESKKKQEDSEFLRSILVLEVFVWLSRILKEEWENSINKKSEKLREMMESAKGYIHSNYTRDISLDDVAKFIYLSTSHFSREFKKAYAISPIQYLLSLRVEAAKELLENTDDKISSIADTVGFANQQRFNDIFKKQTGMSPSQYRSNYRRPFQAQENRT